MSKVETGTVSEKQIEALRDEDLLEEIIEALDRRNDDLDAEIARVSPLLEFIDATFGPGTVARALDWLNRRDK